MTSSVLFDDLAKEFCGRILPPFLTLVNKLVPSIHNPEGGVSYPEITFYNGNLFISSSLAGCASQIKVNLENFCLRHTKTKNNQLRTILESNYPLAFSFDYKTLKASVDTFKETASHVEWNNEEGWLEFRTEEINHSTRFICNKQFAQDTLEELSNFNFSEATWSNLIEPDPLVEVPILSFSEGNNFSWEKTLPIGKPAIKFKANVLIPPFKKEIPRRVISFDGEHFCIKTITTAWKGSQVFKGLYI